MHDLASFGHWIRRRRKALDLTQDALAAQIHCSVTTIRKIEADERRPSRQMAELLAQVLEIDPKEQAAFVKAARSELRVSQLSAPTVVPTVSSPVLPTPAPATPTSSALALPLSTTPLVGRSVELTQVMQLLHTPACRLLTLAGVGGMGKTRLAVECAVQLRTAFAEGVYFIPLAALFAPEFMVQAIANALGFTFYAAGQPKQHLLNYLASKELLLVLDNLEHLLAPTETESAAILLVDLLRHAPRLKLLVTSRERVNVQDEWVFDLQGLALPPASAASALIEPTTLPERYSAVALFVQRAQQAQHSFTLTAHNQAAVIRICQLVDGMPLGIELAATWVHLLSCQEIADEIERNVDFLAVARRDVPPRHRSLRAAFDHSWHLLTDEERRVLRQLAVFQGGFGREAAAQVAQATLPLLAALVAKSLLRRTDAGRYELHELVRQYTYDALCTAQEETTLRNRHLAYYQQLAEQAYCPLFTADQRTWVSRLTAEYGNLRTALEWTLRVGADSATTSAGVRLAGALWLFWWLGDHWLEGAEWLRRLLAVSIPIDQPATQLEYEQARARALYGAATLALDRYEIQQAELLATESLSLCRAVGDQWGLAYSLYQLGVLGFINGEPTERVYELLQRSVAHFRQLAEPRGLSLPLETLGHLARRQGDHQAALALWQEALRWNQTAGDPMGISQSSDLLAREWLRQGEYGSAHTLLAESLTVYRQLGNHFGAAYALLHLGRIAHAQYDYTQARQRYNESQALFQDLGSKEGSTFFQLGRLALEQGDVTTARTLLERSLALAQAVRVGEHMVQAQITLALACLAQAEYDRAQTLLTATLALVQTVADHDYLAQLCCGCAQLALAQGEPRRGARLLGAAQALWAGLGLPPAPDVQVPYEQGLRLARSQLADATFQAARAEGRALSVAQVMAEMRDRG